MAKLSDKEKEKKKDLFIFHKVSFLSRAQRELLYSPQHTYA